MLQWDEIFQERFPEATMQPMWHFTSRDPLAAFVLVPLADTEGWLVECMNTLKNTLMWKSGGLNFF